MVADRLIVQINWIALRKFMDEAQRNGILSGAVVRRVRHEVVTKSLIMQHLFGRCEGNLKMFIELLKLPLWHSCGPREVLGEEDEDESDGSDSDVEIHAEEVI